MCSSVKQEACLLLIKPNGKKLLVSALGRTYGHLVCKYIYRVAISCVAKLCVAISCVAISCVEILCGNDSSVDCTHLLVWHTVARQWNALGLARTVNI